MTLVIGDVIDDILVRPKAPIRPNTDVGSEIINTPGGSAANFACWLASVRKDVNFVGRIGARDLLRHQQNLESFGVIPHLQLDEELPTGSIVVLVESDQRTFLTDRGANQRLDVKGIPKELYRDIVYISGYSLLSMAAKDLAGVISLAHQSGAVVACDPGSAGFIEDFGVKRFLDSLQGVDILLPNLEEGRLLSGEDRPEIICGFLAERFGTVALTMGGQGCAVQQGENFLLLDAVDAELVDSTGAGDAFAAAFLHALATGETLESAGLGGVKLGAKAVTLLGGRP
jgi:sugar/nucleoside kinase (ribokinase family)